MNMWRTSNKYYFFVDESEECRIETTSVRPGNFGVNLDRVDLSFIASKILLQSKMKLRNSTYTIIFAIM